MMWRVALIVIGLCLSLPLRTEEIITLSTRDGVTQSFLLLQPAGGSSQAVAVLFPGGGGNIGLRLEGGRIKFSPNNFLVRSRQLFADHGVAVAVMDAPSDESGGMNDGFRLGDEHARDIQQVVEDLKKHFPAKPVFLVGTSRGTISAAAAGRTLGNDVSGTVLTSTVFYGGRKFGSGLSGFDFGTIKTPVLFVHHAEDGCGVTPYRDAKILAAKFPLITVHGGEPPRSDPCEPLSEHGYLGREAPTVDAIVNWMLKKPYPSEID